MAQRLDADPSPFPDLLNVAQVPQDHVGDPSSRCWALSWGTSDGAGYLRRRWLFVDPSSLYSRGAG